MGKRKAERTEGAAPPKRSLRSRKPKTAGDEHGTPTANHQEAALIQSQDSDKMADPSDSMTNKDPSKPDCSRPGKTIPTCGEDSEKINSKSHDALGGPTAEEGIRGREDTDTGPPEAQGNMSPVCEAADPDPLDSAESVQLVHPPSTMETGPLAQSTSTMATIQLVHPSSSAENISQTKVLDHHTATPTHPLKQTEDGDAEASGGGGCHEMEARDGSGGESGRLTPAEGEVKGSTEVKLGESLSRHRRESMEEEEENSHRPLKEEEEEIGGGRFGPQAQAEVEKVSTEGEKKGGAEVSSAMKEGEEEEQKEEQALNKLEEDVVASTTEMREEEERRSEDRGEEDTPQMEEDETTEKQKDEEDDASQKQEDEKEEISRKQKDEDEASQNQRASVKEEEEESSQGGDDGAAVATGRVAPKRKRMGMGVRRRMGMGRPSERERKTHADGQTSEKEKKTPADGETSEKEKKTPADGQTGEKEKKTPADGQTSEKEKKTPADGQTSEKEKKTPADGQTSEKEKKTPVDGETSEKDRKTPADEQTIEEKKTPADGQTSEKDRKTPADEQTMEEKKTPADGETSGRRSGGGEGGGGVDGDEGEVERERNCGMAEEEKNSVSEMEEARGEMEREKNEGMVEMERSSVAEMEEGGREMEREKSRGATVEKKNFVEEMEREEMETEKKKGMENDRHVVAEEERALPLATVPSEVEEEQQYERRDNSNPGDKEQAAMANNDASRMRVQSTEVKEELDHHNSKDAREEQRTAALQGLESASVPLLTTNQMEAPQVTPLEEHRHTELQPEPEALSSAPTLPSTITVPATKATDAGELSINDHTNTAASLTTDPRGEVPGGQQEVEDDAVMSRAVSEGLASPPDIKSPDRDAMPLNEPHRDTVAPLHDHNRGSVAPSMDHKRDTAGSGSSSHPRPDVAAAPPVEDTSNSRGMQESSVTSKGRGHDPEKAPQVSAELRCHHDDPFDPCDASSFNMVSDSQLNDLISVMEMEDQRGPESFGAAEDATELVCGLITELSSLNRSIMAAHRELESLRRGNRTARTPQRRPFAQRRPDATPPSSS